MQRTYKYRIYPTKEQTKKLEKTLEICRKLYNDCLSERRRYYEENGKGLSRLTQQKLLKERKKKEPYLMGVHSQVLQNVLFRVEHAFNLFFQRLKSKGQKAGYPRYKGKNRYDSFTYPQQPGFRVENGKLKLSKIGTLKIKLHRPIQGEMKTCTIKREIDRWYACISCEIPDNGKERTPTSFVGIDVGIENFATLSNGEKIPNPKNLLKQEKKLKRAQRKLSRKKKGSRNREKQRIKVAKIHRKIKNQRNDFLHKLSRKIVDNFSFIAVENLSIQKMLKNSFFAKYIQDASWGQFVNYLCYKAEEAGSKVVKVDPYGTSQLCSRCLREVPKTLSTRTHECPYCGLEIDRDHNSAILILQRALSTQGTCGSYAWGDLTSTHLFQDGQVGSLNQEAPSVREG